MQDQLRHSQRIAAARAGFSKRTSRRIDADPRRPSQRKPQRRRTVLDALAERSPCHRFALPLCSLRERCAAD
ncbi:hypothetical protein [Marinivivus vitaminiproducens]|uniref:hypothetical protein n=1 Tax=Marinivivus vitaminiproducens TaxID=3035935 RepID=UPI00279949BD|nr:hypothetical protein P4R82_10130 [Geminicoccaceae bacterium SCSIO 64248]